MLYKSNLSSQRSFQVDCSQEFHGGSEYMPKQSGNQLSHNQEFAKIERSDLRGPERASSRQEARNAIHEHHFDNRGGPSNSRSIDKPNNDVANA